MGDRRDIGRLAPARLGPARIAPARLGPARLPTAAGLILPWLAVALLTWGCGPAASPSLESSPMAPTPPAIEATRHVQADTAAFDVPAGWHTRAGAINPSGNRTILFAGPQDLLAECTETAEGGVCQPWPSVTLLPGGTVIAWRVHGLPGSRPPAGGDPIEIGGRPARIGRGPASSDCAAIGGDVSVAVVIVPRAAEPGWTGLDACQAGPDHAAAEAALRQILATVTWLAN
jgi:hypothetical protein